MDANTRCSAAPTRRTSSPCALSAAASSMRTPSTHCMVSTRAPESAGSVAGMSSTEGGNSGDSIARAVAALRASRTKSSSSSMWRRVSAASHARRSPGMRKESSA